MYTCCDSYLVRMWRAGHVADGSSRNVGLDSRYRPAMRTGRLPKPLQLECCQTWPSALPLLTVELCTVSFHAKPVLPIVSSLEIVGTCCDIVQCVGCCLSFSWHSNSGVRAFCRIWFRQRDVVELAIMQTSCQCCVLRTVSACYCTVRVGVAWFRVPRDGRRKC